MSIPCIQTPSLTPWKLIFFCLKFNEAHVSTNYIEFVAPRQSLLMNKRWYIKRGALPVRFRLSGEKAQLKEEKTNTASKLLAT